MKVKIGDKLILSDLPDSPYKGQVCTVQAIGTNKYHVKFKDGKIKCLFMRRFSFLEEPIHHPLTKIFQ